MKSRTTLLIFCMILIMTFSGCATMQKSYHSAFMRGSIIESAGADVYLCVGSADGAQVGQEMDVYRVDSKFDHKSGQWNFTRVPTGKIRITQIVDEHFAKASIISGAVAKNEIAETKVSR